MDLHGVHVKPVTKQVLRDWLAAKGLYDPSSREDVAVTAARALAEFNARQKAGVDALRGLTDEEKSESKLVLGAFECALRDNPFAHVPEDATAAATHAHQDETRRRSFS